SIQIGEFQLLFGGMRLDGATAFSPGANSPGGEGPGQANDNSPNTKWLDFRRTDATLVLDFGESVEVDSYRLATANDSSERDPMSWRVEGSFDGSEWFILDEQIQAPVPEERITYLDDFSVTTPAGTGEQLKITSIDFSPFNNTLTLTWNSIEGATYKVKWSADMTAWDTDLENGIEGAAGNSTTRTFALSGTALEGLSQVFFRVERQ
ncbi:MAG: discoidin domain-containing protein, partial [Akkermansiaceae bacterium]